MTRLTKNKLRQLKIYNPHNIAKVAGNKLYISYTGACYGRLSSSARWQVVGIGFQTEPNGASYNNGHKTFGVYCREDKQPNLEEAMKWCAENYGVTEWERDPFGSYQIKGTLDKIARQAIVTH